MQPIHRSARMLGIVATLAVLGACTAAGASDEASIAPDPTLSAAAPSRAPAPTEIEVAPDAMLVVGQAGVPGLQVILASTRQQLDTLPIGAPGVRWAHVFTASHSDASTVVRDVAVQGNRTAWENRSVEGAWRLPTIGADPLPVGASADESTIVLVEDGERPDGTVTRFAVLTEDGPARIIELPGDFEFDALSPDGSVLYVVEHLAAPPNAHYQVRAVDIGTGQIREAVIVDKRNLDESMGGWPITQLRRDDGVAFTLYRGAEHPFIHALNTSEAWAICLDLPSSGSGDPEAAGDWGLAQSADGRSVFAVNATLGLVASIDVGDLTITRTGTFDAPRAASTITLAKLGHDEVGPVGRRVVAAPDGSTLFAAGAGGVVRIGVQDLRVTGTLLAGSAVDALALTPDGSTLYALRHADGSIAKVDVASGAIVGQVPGVGYDRLVAIVPW